MGIYKLARSTVLKRQSTYANDFNHFDAYFRSIGQNVSNEITLGGIRTKHILASLESLISGENRRYKSKATAYKYMYAIVALFRCLIDEYDLANPDLQHEYNLESKKAASYYKQCQDLIENSGLQDVEIYNALTKDDAEYLKIACDDIIDNFDGKAGGSTRIKFNALTAAIYVKVILFTGVCHRFAYQISRDDFDQAARSLKIRNICVKLPDPFFSQLCRYVNVCDELHYNTTTKSFFVRHPTSKPVGKDISSTGGTYLLDKLIKTMGYTPLIKYRIQQLLIEEAPDQAIRQLTGAEDTIMDACYEAVKGVDYDWAPCICASLPKAF